MNTRIVAVVLACLTSTSAMAASVTSKVVKKIANQEITKRAPELRGQTGPQGAQGPRGLEGVQGPPGPAFPIRYALVSSGGGVDATKSVGIAQDDVVRIAPGTYCLILDDVVIRGGQVTVDYHSAQQNPAYGPGATAHFAQARFAGDGPCPTLVVTYRFDGYRMDMGFYVILYN